MTELWDLVDINKNKTGRIHERERADFIPQEMYHLVVEVWTKTKNNQVLLTQRHKDKHFGLMWECTGGSVIAGESSREGAVRELFEEVGIKTPIDDLIYLGDNIGKRHMVDSYLYIVEDDNIKLTLQEEEVINSKFIDLDAIDNEKDLIVPTVWHRFIQFKDKIASL